ncbi:MAG: glycosyltransferase [Flavobacterium sp.]|nr:MAG: glycosyltransferase [Flavobacterium sp.]
MDFVSDSLHLELKGRPLKVVHISSSYQGGAGIAAFRIHKALLKNGIDSHFLCLNANNADRSMSKPKDDVKKLKKQSLKEIIIDKIKWRLNHHFKIRLIPEKEKIEKEFQLLRPSLKCEVATLPFSSYNVLEDPAVREADIIQLHWVRGFLDYPSFFFQVTQPVVWTLHDMNPLQGLFHYREDELRNNDTASSLNRKLVSLKSKLIWKKRKQLALVTPSKWLLAAASGSVIFKNVQGYTIPYPLDMDIFQPKHLPDLKAVLNIPPHHTVFLFVAEKTDNHRKGFDLLEQALKNLIDKDITLLVIGNSPGLNIQGLQVIFFGTIEDKKELADYYSIADAFILPSREDNLPNVMLESLACGTPVISFEVGGMAEIIDNGVNGLKAKNISIQSLAGTLAEFITIKDKFDEAKIRDLALKTFSEKLISKKYYEVYQSLMKINA